MSGKGFSPNLTSSITRVEATQINDIPLEITWKPWVIIQGPWKLINLLKSANLKRNLATTPKETDKESSCV